MQLFGNISATALLAASTAVSPAVAKDPDPPVQVMVIGSWHMAGSNRNVVDAPGPDVLTPERQEELRALAERLLAFRPTVVAVEEEVAAPGFADPRFAGFGPGMLSADASEEVQIGFRLAALAGLPQVYGIDELADEGGIVYFPFDKLMQHVEVEGRAGEAQEMIAGARELLEGRMAVYQDMPIGRALADTNGLSERAAADYYRMLDFDRGEAQPAAELNGYWFMRNAKIFAKLQDVVEPGDRVVVVYGLGHKHWLDHLVEMTPGYEPVDPVPYLREP